MSEIEQRLGVRRVNRHTIALLSVIVGALAVIAALALWVPLLALGVAGAGLIAAGLFVVDVGGTE